MTESSGPFSAAMPVVEVRGLRVRFGEVEAVAGVDLTAYAGQATALLGRNGAGKSTTMWVLAGVLSPAEGLAAVAGLRREPRAFGLPGRPAVTLHVRLGRRR
ncbi:hypothetical protein GCM10023350_37790 [Nocardioides endophyticus]|uniref:ABC transporter domain-containing protein n=1 Tax=Nocardioides endophyticus TaxID=1353775 RepID=A0ABP8Z847_9ACTN